MRVLLTDKSTLITQRLEELLSEIIFILGTDKASSYDEALALFKQYRQDVVVADMNLADNTSCRLVKEIKELAPHTTIIMMFIDADEYIMEQCKKMGADFFFDKYHEFEKIPVVINEIAANS
ncbi:MAG: response regulator [Ferruginibacter sp.]|nr:response regulator [Ferruginibacter sp.]